MNFTLAFLSIALVIPAIYFLSLRKKTEVASASWDDLVSRLERVPMEGVAKVALDFLQPSRGQLAIATDEMWSLIGEDDGLRRMQANAEVLIAIAGFAAQWNFHESVIVTERMRRDGLALRSAVKEFDRGFKRGTEKVMGPFCVQQAASSYYLMRERLLALYQTSHEARYPRLIAAL